MLLLHLCRSRMKVLLFALALFFIVATILPFFREPYWWVRMFDFPRVQLAVGGVVILGLFLLFYQEGDQFFSGPVTWVDYAVLGLLGLSVVYQVGRILPYTKLYPVESVRADDVEAERSFRLVVTNVLMENREADKWLRVVRAAEPDLVLAVETDDWWDEHAAALDEDLPHTVKLPQDNTYGMLLFSRWPLHDLEIKRLVEEDVPSLWGSFELPSGDRVRFVFIHPRPPRPDLPQHSHFRDAELVLVAEEIEGVEGAILVAGDLNDVAWSYTTRLFQKLSGLLDPRIGRGLYSTFHADYVVLRWPLDHLFHSDELQLVSFRRLDHVGSDHFPMLIELVHRPRQEEEQDEPEADGGDREQAEEILEDAAERKADETPEEKREKQKEDR